MPVNRAKEMLDQFQARGTFPGPRWALPRWWISGDLAEALDLPTKGGLLIQRMRTRIAGGGSRLARAAADGGGRELSTRRGRRLIVEVEGQAVEATIRWCG